MCATSSKFGISAGIAAAPIAPNRSSVPILESLQRRDGGHPARTALQLLLVIVPVLV
jgi:hypothetical protein